MKRARTVLVALTVAACLPYLTLKVIWLTGGRTGIPRGSLLLDGGATLWVLNALTVAMDCTVILLALALTRPWGRRLPGGLLALPLWCAGGLLGPIAVAFPLQAVHSALTGGADGHGDAGPHKVLADWVWTLVYTGFTVQALGLGTLFALYVRERWGALLRSPLRPGRPRPHPADRTSRYAFTAAVLLAVPATVVHARDAVGDDGGNRITDATFALYAVVAVAAVGVLLRSGSGARGSRARLWPTLTAAWIGSAVLACWGGWLLVGALSGAGRHVGQRADGVVELSYACQTLAGLALAAVMARVVRHRTHASSPSPARV
ncbi:hypothetical protein MMF93_07345 [Streptomyces tubbatahanensis]|uniref:LigA protein n=1 Tax=Streptomyces tubbatahanensis TaxID=2923272 RepID=A0ABY3XPF2_9ACTN|nr:hypothetical protein [Streptomyces tubbatahanensis]UNS96337.1 hypothetical protein MMF93_07345 [Streptomyces tubbatahanensis]